MHVLNIYLILWNSHPEDLTLVSIKNLSKAGITPEILAKEAEFQFDMRFMRAVLFLWDLFARQRMNR